MLSMYVRFKSKLHISQRNKYITDRLQWLMVKSNSRFMFKRYYLIQEMYFSIRNIY